MNRCTRRHHTAWNIYLQKASLIERTNKEVTNKEQKERAFINRQCNLLLEPGLF